MNKPHLKVGIIGDNSRSPTLIAALAQLSLSSAPVSMSTPSKYDGWTPQAQEQIQEMPIKPPALQAAEDIMATGRVQNLYPSAPIPTKAIIATIIQRLLDRQLEEAQKRDGNWMDSWGSCRVCGGEIPHGHSDNCDIYKQEQEIRQLTTSRDSLIKILQDIRDMPVIDQDDAHRLREKAKAALDAQ